jgi:4-aminobutyrate aminotransferase-like enzyme
VLLSRRQSHFAKPQKNYYETPPQIERGWREHMFDVEGRAYLDMVNNVTILGHGHPRLADAVSEQWLRLNTNSRFHYAAVAEFSERLAALAPEGLDTVFLVNSGSEANDLALRLAWAAHRRPQHAVPAGRPITAGRLPATPSPPRSPTIRRR